MLVEIEQNQWIDCNLIRMNDEGIRTDYRVVSSCKSKEQCSKCMWNVEYAMKHKKELKLQDMTEEELDALKQRNKMYPITATKLQCMKVDHERAV